MIRRVRRDPDLRSAIVIMSEDGERPNAYVYPAYDWTVDGEPWCWSFNSSRWGYTDKVYPTRHAAVMALRKRIEQENPI